MRRVWFASLLLVVLAVGCGDPQPSPFDDVPSADVDVVTTDADDVAPGPDQSAVDAAPDVAPDRFEVGLDASSPDADASVPADADADVASVVDADALVDVLTRPDADASMPPDVAAPDVADVAPLDGPAPMCPAPLLSTLTLPSPMPVTVMGMTSGTSANAGTSCQSNAGGPEHYYRLDVTERSVVSLSTEGTITTFDTILAVRRDCASAASEVACDDDGGDSPATASRLRTVLDRGTYALLVDGYNTGSGRYQLVARASPAAANGACMTATTLTPGTPIRGQSVEGGYDPAFPCQAVTGAGQVFYEVMVPAGSAATVTVTPTGMPADWSPVVRIFDRCGATSCAAVTTGGVGMPGVATVNNETGAARTYRVSVSSSTAATGGLFDISVAVGAPRMGSACSLPLPLTVGAEARGSFFDATVTNSACRTAATGRVLYYRVDVPAATRIELVVTPEGTPAWTPVVRVLDGCSATSCAFDGQGTSAGMPFTLSFANTGAMPRTYLVAVGATAPTTGGFTLRATSSALGVGTRCATPFVLRADMAVMGRNLSDGVDQITACRPTSTGRVQYYAVDLPARSVATLRVTPSSSPGWTPVVRVLPTCESTTCLVDVLGSFGAASTHVFANEDAADRRVLVVVGATSVTSTGTYDLSLSIAPAALGEVCTQPVTLSPGVVRTAQRLEDGRLPPTVCRVSGGPVRYYALTVNGRQSYTVRVTRTSTALTWTPQVRVVEGCSATTCEFDALGASTTTPLEVRGVNDSVAPRTYIITVNASSTAVPMGTYDIIAAVSDPVAGALCAAPVGLTPTAPAMMQNTANAGTSSLACLTSSTGPQLFYSVRIPAGQRARVVASPVTGTTATPVLRALDGCAAAACVTSVTGTSTGATLDIPNYDTAPRDLIVSLGTTSRTTSGTYNVTVALSPAMEGQFCERATAVVTGTAVRGSTTNGVTTAFGCLGGSYGPQSFYRVTVPAGRRVVVTATPMTSSVALRLRSVSSCAATSCHVSSTGAAAGAPATFTFTNPTLSDRQVFFSVAASTTTTNTDFTLTAVDEALVPPPPTPAYSAALITASCDTLPGATTVVPTAGWADESATPLASLPFPFRLFTDMMTQYAVSSNGNLQLFDAAGGAPSTSGFNASLPSTSTPNGLVAPFWDDFTADTASVVRTATLGAMGSRRFVVEWRNWRFLAEPGAPLNFQAKLFEGTGVVEFHYCPSSSVGTERTVGNSATVGLEDRSGTLAALVSLDWPNATRPGNGWRITPR